jgi:hypothetical protein
MMSDVCEIADDVPEVMFSPFPPAGQAIQPGIQFTVRDVNGVQGVTGAPGSGTWTSLQYCHQETPWQGQYKALGSYTLPYDVRVSGTWQSIVAPQLAAFTTYSNNPNNATTFSPVTLTTLGNQPLTNGATTLNLIEPGTQWGDRLNQFDLRFSKILSLPKGRVDLNFDLYNAFNSDAITIPLNSVGPVGVPFGYGFPLQAIPPRFAKLSARWDF